MVEEKLTPKEARLWSRKKQTECANLLGISVSTYRKLEKNPSRFTIDQAKKLGVFLGIKYDLVYFG